MADFRWVYVEGSLLTASGPTGSLQFRGNDNGQSATQSGSANLVFHTAAHADYAANTLVLTGTLIVTGAISASSYHIEDVTNLNALGSTTFGDSFDDTHKFSGSVRVTSSASPGNIAASLSASGEVRAAQFTTSGKVLATGSVSSSGEIFANSMRTSGQLRMSGSLSSSGELYGYSLRSSGGAKISGALEIGDADMLPLGGASKYHLVSGAIWLTSSIASKISGAISSSGEIFGANLRTSGYLHVTGTSKLKGAVSSSNEIYGTSLRTSGQLRMSGSLSSSGELYGHSLRTSGELSTSGSANLGDFAPAAFPSAYHNVTGALYLTSSLASRISGNVIFKGSTVMVTGTLRLTGSEAGILVIEKAPGDTTKEIVFVEQGTEQGGIYFNNGDHLFIRNENNAKDIILRIENGSGAGRNLIRLDGTNEGVVVGFANSKTETSLNAVLDVDGNTVVSGTLKSTGHISSVGGVTASVALSGTNLYLPAPSGTIAGGDSYLAVDNTGRVILTPKPGAVGGSDNQVQYNNDGVLAGSSNLTWDDNELRVVGQISASTLKVHGDIRTTGSLFVDTNLDVDGQLNADNAISGGAEIYGHHLRTSGDVKASGTLSSSYFQIQGVQLTRQAIISADSSIALQANQIILGTNGDVDINLDFNANSNDGRITWSEDEDYFAFADDIAMPAGEAIFFRDANQKLISDNAGHLDIYADDNIELHAEDIICSGTLQVLSGNNTVFQVDAEDGDTGDNGLLRAKQITITQHNFDFNAVNTSRWVPWQDDAGATFPGSPNQAFFRIQPFGGRLLKVVLMIEGWGDPGDLPLEMGLGFYTGSAPYGGAGAVNRFIDSSIWKGSVTGTMSNPSFGGYQNQKPMPLIINLSGSETFHRTGSFTFKPGKTVGMSLTVGGTDPEAILMTCVWEYDYFDEFFAPIQAGTGTV